MKKRWKISVLLVIFILLGQSRMLIASAADTNADDPAHILYISSYSYSWETVPLQIEGVDRAFKGNDYVVNYEFMDTKNTTYSEGYQEFYDILSYKMNTRYPYDAIIVGDDAALNFVSMYRDQLFQDIPVVFLGVDNVENGLAFAQQPKVSGIVEQVDYQKNVEIAKQLMPDADRIVFILDNMENGLGIAKQLEEQKAYFAEYQVDYLNSSDYTKDELCDVLGSYTMKDIVFYISMGQQKDHVIYTENERYQMMREYTNVPLFRVTPAGVGSCALGGYVVDFEKSGYLAGEMVKEMLNDPQGENPDVIMNTPEMYYFDYQILEQYGLDISVLPEDAHIINEPESFWKTYSFQIIIGLLLIMLGIVFFVLAVILISRKRIQEKNVALLRAEETEANFMATMSHDMRTPMNGILGIAKLSEDVDDPVKLHEDFEKVKESGTYMLELINDILDYQRMESGKLKLEPKICSTRKIIDSALVMVRTTAEEKKVKLVSENEGANLNSYIRVDPIRISQVMVNLLSNAVKFTPPGGIVKFRIELVEREGRRVKCRIIISDTGVGMSKDFVENKLYTPFAQEQNEMSMSYAGSGLGLSIVKNLVDLMGAELEVESELGSGTTFTIKIAFETVSQEEVSVQLREEQERRQNENDRLQGARILLCEDHPLNAEIVKRLLEKQKIICDWANTGERGYQMFEEADENYYAAILMDIRMPGMDGIETTEKIRNSKIAGADRIPIIAMSANAFPEDIRKSIAAGMNEHLTKPIQVKQLFDTLLEYI